MLFGTIEREKCFFMGSLSPICMKTAAQLLKDWELAEDHNWTEALVTRFLVTRFLHRQPQACPRA